MKDKES